MKIAVFGASGFIGRNVVEALKSTHVDIITTDIREFPDKEVPFKNANLLDYRAVYDVVEGSDIVIHLAASALGASLEKPQFNARINIEGSLNIMDACRATGVKKIIFSSASSIVGVVKYYPVNEDHPLTPKTPYAIAKQAVENYLRVYNELYGLNYLIFRFFNIYGPWQYPESGAVIPTVYTRLKATRGFTVYGDGNQLRDFVYVDDLAKIYVEAIQKDIKNEIVNLGSGNGTTIKEIVHIAGKLMGMKPKITYAPKKPGEIENFVADTTKLKKLFGMVPATPLNEGLAKTFNWMERRNHGT